MGTNSKFKVVIGGGSITGLTLANMLQLYDIDFVVLESYSDIAPQVGASIGMLPHGNRILDQLGLYQKLLELSPPLDSFHFRDHTGKILCEFRGMNHSMGERHGYPIIFLDRQMVLKLLYENIRDKSKILTNKRVKNVRITDDGVLVNTADGSSYQGDILVGADGIHSTVRTEMWNIANKMAPGWFPSDEHNSVPVDYGCIFGISNPCQGIEPGASNSVFKKHASYIVNGGAEGRVYWFYFFKLAKRAYGEDIPSYTKEDEKKILAARENDNITPTLKFKDILDNKITSVLVPLQEYVFKRWYFKRIITIGDAAHKFHPIAGHGGNACVESAATLVNSLRNALANSRHAKPTLKQIEQVFARTQDIRQARTTTLKEHSHEQQRTELLDTPFHQFIAFHILPKTDTEDVTFNFSRNMPLSEKLDDPQLKSKDRLVPYKDELLSTPTSRGIKKWYFIMIYLSIAAMVHYGMWVHSAHYGLGKHLENIIKTGKYSYDPNFTLKRTYIGVKPIDDYLVFLAAVYMPGLKRWEHNFANIQMYFLGMLVQPIAIWSVEAYRKRNALTPLTLITIWFTLVQWAGIGIYMPIYYAIYTYVSEPETYWWPLNREVRVQYAKSLTWAVMIGYTLPTFLMFSPWKDPNTLQVFEALWQISPMLVPLLGNVLGLAFAKCYNLKPRSPKAKEAFADVTHLKNLYLITGTLGFVLHVFCITKILSSPDSSLKSVFWPDFAATPKGLGEGLSSIFLADFWGFFIATYVWLCMAVWDLKRVGRTVVSVGKASTLIALGFLVVGPGATMSAVWSWREDLLATTCFAGRLN
ncbi:FAD-binding domain-containing protein [Aaosphaeria arxii CBS 175.79]|uniref:FAD-binding domain-containing protein n=1 Tax=Aaosphaeria arxii CBS 175.79 TaxID=1450172 RepID=A0A6A5Y3G8_9PLEO|nr:FAD-binding domain-containing protein [Aaosphaeria arxii CBS 175.79]KAF2020082.1 FAD-binding domain-containing protein [Aaosphaeria arxii CBS 175.79]